VLELTRGEKMLKTDREHAHEPDLSNRWHQIVQTPGRQGPDALLPMLWFSFAVVHTPQTGKKITGCYLNAANAASKLHLGTQLFCVKWSRQSACWVREPDDGVQDQWRDMIVMERQVRSIDFKVMVRPLKAINAFPSGQWLDAVSSAKG